MHFRCHLFNPGAGYILKTNNYIQEDKDIEKIINILQALYDLRYRRFKSLEEIKKEIEKSLPGYTAEITDEEDYENTIDEVKDFDYSLWITLQERDSEDGPIGTKVWYLKDNGGRYLITETQMY